MADDPLTKAVSDALVLSLKADEPNWPTQRNWDAADGKAIRLHTANVVSALRAPSVAVATLAHEDEPGTITVKVDIDPDELRHWATLHANAGHHGVAHALYEAAKFYSQLDPSVQQR